MEDRPPPSPSKLLGQFRDWVKGSEQPGRTMSYLKTSYLPQLLEEAPQPMLDAWEQWEKGRTDPTSVLETLRDEGLEDLLAGMAND